MLTPTDHADSDGRDVLGLVVKDGGLEFLPAEWKPDVLRALREAEDLLRRHERAEAAFSAA